MMTEPDIVSEAYGSARLGNNESLTIHWRAVFAGIFIALLVYFSLISLGLALGADQARDVIEGTDSPQAIGVSAAIWLVVSTLIALCVGSYAAGRISGVIATRIGYMQGAVISALFFTVMMTQAGVLLGYFGSGIGAVGKTISGVASNIGNSSAANALIEDGLNDMELNLPPAQVASGIISRLVRGDTDAAANYLAAHSGISATEATSRLETMQERLTAFAQEARRKATYAAQQVGWMAFLAMALGTVFAMLGGGIGALFNMRRPISSMDQRAYRAARAPAYT